MRDFSSGCTNAVSKYLLVGHILLDLVMIGFTVVNLSVKEATGLWSKLNEKE